LFNFDFTAADACGREAMGCGSGLTQRSICRRFSLGECMQLYMNWTMPQWAEAVAWFSRVKGMTPLPDHQGAMQVRAHWLARHTLPPSDKRLILVDEWSRPSRRYSEREVMLIDDVQELRRRRDEVKGEGRCIETNMQWAVHLFVYAMNQAFT
jgi:hypothetical protein